jgi:hypothetical protein
MTPYESKQQEKLMEETMEVPTQVTVERLVELGYTCFTTYIGGRGQCKHWYHEEYPSYPTYTFDPQGKLLQEDFSKDSHAKVKSDGGSSSYYTLDINGTKVETEDIIRDVFGNDFDFGNAFKSLVRAYLETQGKGKEGNDLAYELNKIEYSTNKIRGVK